MNEPLTRRKLLLAGAAVPLLLSDRRASAQSTTENRPALNPDRIQPFVDPLPVPHVLQAIGTKAVPGQKGLRAPYYRLSAQEFACKIHRHLPPTRLWGYASSSPGPIIETRSGEGILIEWVNQLPRKHFLPVDHTIEGAEDDKPEVRMVSHLHGGRVPPESDGYPESWYETGKSALHYYPNKQDAVLLWYHDHAMGINRLNIYAGMFGPYIIRDSFEDSLNLPKGKYEIPLVIYDRFVDEAGQLYYPTSGDPKSPWIPELFANLIMVNGKLFPYLEVEPRRYRFRVLNSSNARHFHLSFLDDKEFHQIGSDQGLLTAPVSMKALLLAPGERADLIVDFSGHRGQNIVVKDDAVSVLQFRVSNSDPVKEIALPEALRPVTRIAEASAVTIRVLTLGEKDDLAQRPLMMLLNRTRWKAPITEKPVLNSTEIWTLVNLTEDTHPIHLHLVRFQILDRRPYNVFSYLNEGKLEYFGPPEPPAAGEMGWKDTVRADPKMVTRIIVKFEGYAGRYVWHCHILEHEDNEMMRPYEVLPS